MTRWLLVALFAAVPVVATAQSTAENPPKHPWANKLFLPDILKNPGQESPEVVSHDFGTVPAGTICSHTFTFTNIYDVPLQVVDVRLECGCLKAFPPNKVLQPNEQAKFTVTMNAALFKGAATKKMYVTVGPGYVSTAELRFSAVSREDVAVTDPGMIDFGIVPQGSTTQKTVTIRYTGKEKDWKIESCTVSNGIYTAEVKETSRGFLSTDYKVTIGLKANAPAGPLSDSVLLKTNDPATPTVTVAIGGSVQPPVSVTTDRVIFEGVKPGETATRKVLVRATSKCRLTGVEDDGDGVSVETFPQSREVHIVTVRFTPASSEPVRKVIRLATDLPGQPAVEFVVESR